jgi:FkbM family methyltransferase
MGREPRARHSQRIYDPGVPADEPFISYAQNREDVVLWRALGHIPNGRYVEVGANHPVDDSVTKAFYDRGWSGITVEPMHDLAESHRTERPRDTMVEAVVTDRDVESIVLHEIVGTGLSTIVDSVGLQHADGGIRVVDRVVPAVRLSEVLDENGGPGQEVHFMLVDTEGSERAVLASVDLGTFRPWVLVIESTAPNSTRQTHEEWEPILSEAGYVFCLFDGLSRFYVAKEHAARLQGALSYPACPHDRYVEARAYDVWLDRERLTGDVRRWRAEALERWADAIVLTNQQSDAMSAELDAARQEVAALRNSMSWRITAPLRTLHVRLSRR